MFYEHTSLNDYTKFADYKLLMILFFGLILLLSGGVKAFNTSVATSKTAQSNNITLYYITTREPEEFNKLDPLNPNYTSKERKGYGNDNYQNISKLKEQSACNNGSIVIFVHGWEESEKNVEERLNRLKLSLAQDGYTGPLVGFSWPSDTVWLGAQFIAQANGPKLAKLIYNITNDCPNANIRIIAHSLGARVVLSSLDSLHQNPLWTTKNNKIASVHLLGAAVDDEEVSNRSEFITIDQTNWGSPKSDYGQAIEAEVTNFTNLFSSKDNLLRPNPNPALAIYPTFESDLALGQSGYQKNNILNQYDIKKSTALPKNYNEINVTGELLANCDTDGDGVPDYASCDIIPMTTGGNHRGYLGYRDNATKLITNDGAINVVISSWNNKPHN
jgi:hypothetical protein